MSIQVENHLSYWKDRFDDKDFKELIRFVELVIYNQKKGLRGFLLIKYSNKLDASRLILSIRNIIGSIHCQHLNTLIDKTNHLTKLFTYVENTLPPEVEHVIHDICSPEYSQETHTNANVLVSIDYSNNTFSPMTNSRATIINMISTK
jgi:hypothetical protein